MADVFLSYRRSDARGDAGRLYDRLSRHFGDSRIFMDVDDIGSGQDFVEVLESTLGRCNVLLVLIGPRWLEARDAAGRTRLDDPGDLVRLELLSAIRRGITIIPVLVGGARVPVEGEIPGELAPLLNHQAHELSDARFHGDVDSLIDSIEQRTGGALRSWLARHVRPSLTGAAIVLLLLGALLAWLRGVQNERAASLRTHIDVAEQLVADGRYVKALSEYEVALELAPDDPQVHRKLVTTAREHLLREAFLDGDVDVALGRGFRGFELVPPAQVDSVLRRLYALQSLDPAASLEVEFWLDKALIMKASGVRMDAAVEALERARELAADDVRVLSELGLLLVVVKGREEGLPLMERSVALAPDVARHHFYLARGLASRHRCSSALSDREGAADGVPCARALRAYRRAAELASGDDVWARQIHRGAVAGAFEILRRHARTADGILDPSLDMPLAERLDHLRYLLPLNRDRSRMGWEDDPNYWLAMLHEALGQPDAARRVLESLFEETGQRPQIWEALYARVLPSELH